LQWDDATENAPKAPPARIGGGDEAKLLYKRPTGATAAFADAAAVMVPDTWTGPEFPSLLMGDRHAPAKLYYWNASTGAEVLKSSGRSTPQPIGQTVPHRARHTKVGWTVILELPDLPNGYPIAFALWDGEYGDRDGLKFFSIWYALLKD
jgi:DMSO reductase family type II enzyme heme b subunit